MSNDVTITPAKVKAPTEPLLSPKNRKLIKDPLNDSNPITVQVLGICSALAVTVIQRIFYQLPVFWRK